MRYYVFLFCLLSSSSSIAMDHDDHSRPSLRLQPSSSASSSLDFPQLSDDAEGLAPHSSFTRDDKDKRTVQQEKKTRCGEETSIQLSTLPAIPQDPLSQPSGSSSSNSPMTPQEDVNGGIVVQWLSQATEKRDVTPPRESFGVRYANGRGVEGRKSSIRIIRYSYRMFKNANAQGHQKAEEKLNAMLDSEPGSSQ